MAYLIKLNSQRNTFRLSQTGRRGVQGPQGEPGEGFDDAVLITDLPAAIALDGTEIIPAVQGTDDVKVTTQQIVDLASAGTGDVSGPASATANAITRFSGTGGKTIKNSTVTLSDTGELTGATLITPTIADFTNATHTHSNAATGGTIPFSNITAGSMPLAAGAIGFGDLGIPAMLLAATLGDVQPALLITAGGLDMGPGGASAVDVGYKRTGTAAFAITTSGTARISGNSTLITIAPELRLSTVGTNAASAVTVGGAQTLTSKTLTTPTISSTGFTNAQHAHTGATSGGQLTDAALSSAVTVAKGGTGRTTSTTAYGIIAAGTTATGAHQTLATGTADQVLVSGGASALPTWSSTITTAVTTASDVEITDATKGIIIRSPDNTRWRVTVGDDGSLTTSEL